MAFLMCLQAGSLMLCYLVSFPSLLNEILVVYEFNLNEISIIGELYYLVGVIGGLFLCYIQS